MTGIENFELPSSNVRICDFCFSDCSNLKNVILPSTIKEIGDRAFDGCLMLTNFVINSPVPPILGDGVFSYNVGDFLNLSICVPAESLTTYQSYCDNGTNGWSIELKDKLQAIA